MIYAALFSAALLISACSQSDRPAGGDPSSESTTASVDTPAPEEAPGSSDPASTQQSETVTSAQDGAEQRWKETPADKTMYAAFDGVTGFAEALEESETLSTYRLNEKLHIIALTDTGFYKLESGEFIRAGDLSEAAIDVGTVTTTPDATIYTTTPAKE